MAELLDIDAHGRVTPGGDPVSHRRSVKARVRGAGAGLRSGAFARLGQGGAEDGCFLHNSNYDFNDAVIPLGAGYLAALAERAMPLAGP